MEENKYFTPSIEDIRVGYELEWKLNKVDWIEYYDKSVYDWQKHVITENDFHGGELGDDFHSFGNSNCEFRVPYLTQEQIETEGWVEGKKGRFELQQITILQDEERTDWLVITETIKDKQQLAFKGECKDINTFRYICKLLRI